MAQHNGLFSIAEWLLTPEGAVVQPVERTAVIADVHLGYEWARGRAGDSVPAHSLRETIARLDRLLHRIDGAISSLIVAGDLVESRRPCRRTAEDVRQLRHWLDQRGVCLIPLAGNHDPQTSVETVRQVAGWTIGHGHEPIPGERVISGHLHPVFRLHRVAAPCFLACENRIVLPAFSNNAAGLDILEGAHALDFPNSPPRCLVSTGVEILDFGILPDLLSRTRSPAPFVSRRQRR